MPRKYFLRVIPTLTHYSDIVSDIPSGSIVFFFSKYIPNIFQIYSNVQLPAVICKPERRAGKIQVGFFHQSVCRGLQASRLGHRTRRTRRTRCLKTQPSSDRDHPLSRRANFLPNPRPLLKRIKMDIKVMKAY